MNCKALGVPSDKILRYNTKSYFFTIQIYSLFLGYFDCVDTLCLGYNSRSDFSYVTGYLRCFVVVAYS